MKSSDRWWLVFVQAAVALVLGIYILSNPAQATTLIGLLAAAYLFIAGLTQLFSGMTGRGAAGTNTSAIRGIVGIVVGAGLLLAGWAGWIDITFGFTILAIGLIIYGGLGLFAAFFDRGGTRFSWGPILVNALLAIWGILIFVSRAQELDLTIISGWILLAIGVIAAIWGFLVRPKGDDDSEENLA